LRSSFDVLYTAPDVFQRGVKERDLIVVVRSHVPKATFGGLSQRFDRFERETHDAFNVFEAHHDAILETLDAVLQTAHVVLETARAILETLHAVLQTAHVVLETAHAILETLHAVLETAHVVLETLHVVVKPVEAFSETFHVSNELRSRQHIVRHHCIPHDDDVIVAPSEAIKMSWVTMGHSPVADSAICRK
jgi:hypothetical protein